MCSRNCWVVTFFCTFPIGNFLSEGRFWTTTLPHPSPNCHQSQKLEFCSYFCPKKSQSFALLTLSLVFCTFPIVNFLSEGRFWTTTFPHHTPPPIPKLSSITKTRILFVFLPKKVPVFCLYFYKNEPVWRIRHTALSDFSLNPSIRQLLIDVAASHKSSPIFWWDTSWKFSMYAWGKKVKVLVFRECMYV